MVQYRTTPLERFLLMATIVLLPLEAQLHSVGGFSIVWIVFAVLGGYVLMNRLRAVARTMFHPVFLVAYALLVQGFMIESLHPNSSFMELRRIGEMIGGAVLVASICRDRGALRAGVYGYLIAGVCVASLFFITSYGVLRAAEVADFAEASHFRTQFLNDRALEGNLNGQAFTIALGAVMALAFVLTSPASRRRTIFLGLALFCFVGTFLPMSRSGIIIAIVSCATLMLTYTGKRARAVVVAIFLGAGVLILVPNIAYKRLELPMEAPGGKMEGRVRLLKASIENLPQYVTTGVGTGNFWGSWGYYNGFAGGLIGHVEGSHNCFLQVTIYWGLLGLVALITLVWQAFLCLPNRCGGDVLSLCLLGIAVCTFLFMLAMHNLYAKEFSLALGLLVGARRWIWPERTVKPLRLEKSRLRFRSEHV